MNPPNPPTPRPPLRYAFFGAALDPLDSAEKIALQRAYLRAIDLGLLNGGEPADPYDLFRHDLADWLDERGLRDAGRLPVPSWLTPRPRPEDRNRIVAAPFSRFLDRNGCAELAGSVRDFVETSIFPDLPVLFGVDHALTGGVLRALSRRFGPDRLSVAVVDAHFDGIPTAVRRAIRTGEAGRVGSPDGVAPLEPYHCGNFLAHILGDGTILPERLFVFGAADRPDPSPEAGGGPGITRYNQAYRSFLDRGVRVVGRDELAAPGGAGQAARLIEEAGSDWVYISIDADAGSRRAVLASRFLDLTGSDEGTLVRLASALGEAFASERIRLAGLDVMEVDVHKAGVRLPSGREERTVPVLSHMVRAILP